MLARLLLTIRQARNLWRVLSAPKNRRKGGWHLNSYFWLHRRLRDELREFEAELWAYEQGKGSLERLEAEAADVTAFLAFLVDKARRSRSVQPHHCDACQDADCACGANPFHDPT